MDQSVYPNMTVMWYGAKAAGSVTMISVFESVAPFGLIIWIPPALAFPFLMTRVVSNIKARCGSKNGEPPLIPWTIPWVGHGWFFRRGTTHFSEWIRKTYPNLPVSKTLVIGNPLYTVFDAKLASQIDRRPKIFTFDPIVLLVNRAFGAPKPDLDIFWHGSPAASRGLNDKGDSHGLIHELHRQHFPGLNGQNLPPMVFKFSEILAGNLDKEFPKKRDSNTSLWVTLDFKDFVMRHVTLAAIPMIMGTRLLEIWPSAYRDIWEFDSNTSKLTMGLPRIIAPAASAILELMISVVERWEEDAYRHKSFDAVESENPVWDAYWGARLVRQRQRTFLDNGISKRGRASFHLGILWATTSNAVPAATWMLIRCVLDPQLQKRVRNTVSSFERQNGTLDIESLAADKFMKSLFFETMRLYVSSPSLRIILETTQLGGYTFQKGGMVIVPGRELQTNADVWASGTGLPGPFEFWPERFIDRDISDEGSIGEESKEHVDPQLEDKGHMAAKKGQVLSGDATSPPGNTRSKQLRERMQSMRPFGGGPALCPGRNSAMFEIFATAAIILSKFEIEVDKEALALNGIPQPDLNVSAAMPPDRPFVVRMRRLETGQMKDASIIQ